MPYAALATDYDGTLARDGRADEAALAALARLRAAGWRLILATGRELDDLRRLMPRLDSFDRVVAEDGAVLHDPATGTVRLQEVGREQWVEAEQHGGASLPGCGRGGGAYAICGHGTSGIGSTIVAERTPPRRVPGWIASTSRYSAPAPSRHHPRHGLHRPEIVRPCFARRVGLTAPGIRTTLPVPGCPRSAG